jgi:hypothetical protein
MSYSTLSNSVAPAHRARTSSREMPSKHGPRTVVRVSATDHPKNGLEGLVHSHHVNHAVAVTLPGADAAACWGRHSNIDEATYSVLELPLVALVPAHISRLESRKPSQTAAASLGRRIDGQGAASSTHSGDIVLDVDAETFQVLGVQGQRCAKQAGEQRAAGGARPPPHPHTHTHAHARPCAAGEAAEARRCCARRHPALRHPPPDIL